MARVRKQTPILASLLLAVFLPLSLLRAERTEEFEQQLSWYYETYDFMAMKDTVYTFETEFRFPEGYRRLDSAELSPYAYWVSHFPLWHRWKAIGMWRGSKRYEPDEVTRCVHLPWKGPLYRSHAIPLRILSEYLRHYRCEFDLQIAPKAGELLTYEKWLKGKPVFSSRNEVFFRPVEQRDTSAAEYFKHMHFCMQVTDFRSLAGNCDSVAGSEITPGDMLIAHDESARKGKVYVILNMLVNEAGDKLYVVATGCEQACDFHIPLVSADRDYPWISLEQVKALTDGMPFSGFFRFKAVSRD